MPGINKLNNLLNRRNTRNSRRSGRSQGHRLHRGGRGNGNGDRAIFISPTSQRRQLRALATEVSVNNDNTSNRRTPRTEEPSDTSGISSNNADGASQDAPQEHQHADDVPQETTNAEPRSDPQDAPQGHQHSPETTNHSGSDSSVNRLIRNSEETLSVLDRTTEETIQEFQQCPDNRSTNTSISSDIVTPPRLSNLSKTPMTDPPKRLNRELRGLHTDMNNPHRHTEPRPSRTSRRAGILRPSKTNSSRPSSSPSDPQVHSRAPVPPPPISNSDLDLNDLAITTHNIGIPDEHGNRHRGNAILDYDTANRHRSLLDFGRKPAVTLESSDQDDDDGDDSSLPASYQKPEVLQFMNIISKEENIRREYFERSCNAGELNLSNVPLFQRQHEGPLLSDATNRSSSTDGNATSFWQSSARCWQASLGGQSPETSQPCPIRLGAIPPIETDWIGNPFQHVSRLEFHHQLLDTADCRGGFGAGLGKYRRQKLSPLRGIRPDRRLHNWPCPC